MNRELDCLVEALPGLAWIALPDGQIDFLNQRWCQYTGLSLQEGRGWGWLAAIHPDDLSNLRARWHAILASGQPGEIEARLRRFDGAYRWFLLGSNPLRDAAGQITRWCGLSSDIGDRLGAEEALRHARAQIVDGIPVPVALMTADGQVELVNRLALEYFGKTAPELKNWTTSDAVHPDDLPQVAAAWRSAVETGHPYEVESRHRRADGVYRWFRVSGFPMHDRDGRIARWYVLQTDVDDRKRTEFLLNGENRLLEMMARGEPLAAILTELCRLVEAVCSNCACCSILRLDAETKRLWHVASPRVPRAYTEAIDGFAIGPEVSSCGTAAYRGEQVIASDIATDPRWAGFRDVALENGLRACWSTPIFSQQRRVLGTFAMFSGRAGSPTAVDQEVVALVTHLGSIAMERALNEAALGKARSELAQVARATSLSTLTASIAHEVNQPLSGIITNASTCLRMLSADPPNVAGALETARRTIRDGNRAAEVIQRLRALFAKKDLVPEAVDLNEAIREVIVLSRSELQRSQVLLRPDLAADLPPVAGDRVQLQQVVLNLLRNAADAMNGVNDRPRRLRIRTECSQADSVCLSVQDAGVGIEPQTVERLFEPFYTTKTDGMGMGLSISRSIIESHHGRIWAQPNRGPGATFAFSIPRRPDGSGPTGLTSQLANVGAGGPSAAAAPPPRDALSARGRRLPASGTRRRGVPARPQPGQWEGGSRERWPCHSAARQP
ncbi:MAG: PAS domain-containing protein [Terriglobales bacterium]